ncbi:MAG TPA: hypothetical protein PLQ93_10565 [Bacteroidia bacterium]|nr:hypothetical protein [Bacteroidia bacterium]
MKTLCLILMIGFSAAVTAQKSFKSKPLRIKYSLPEAWNVQEFGKPNTKTWEEAGNELCACSGILFYRSHKDGKMNVVLYPSTQSGLDSAKRDFVGKLKFVDVEKYDNIRNNGMSFRRKKSNFTDTKTGAKSFEVYRYFTKVDDHYYIIYAWQENMQVLSSTNEKMLFDLVNSIETY